MATSQTASLTLQFSASAIKDGRNTTAGITDQRLLTNGTTVGTADKAYYENRTIAYQSTPDNLDFIGGGLIDINGDAITWAEITTLAIKAGSTNSVVLTVGGHANPLNFGSGSNTITIKPGETKVLIDSSGDGDYPLSAGSSDTLKVAIASSANHTYEIFAVGRSV